MNVIEANKNEDDNPIDLSGPQFRSESRDEIYSMLRRITSSKSVDLLPVEQDKVAKNTIEANKNEDDNPIDLSGPPSRNELRDEIYSKLRHTTSSVDLLPVEQDKAAKNTDHSKIQPSLVDSLPEQVEFKKIIRRKSAPNQLVDEWQDDGFRKGAGPKMDPGRSLLQNLRIKRLQSDFSDADETRKVSFDDELQ